MTPKGKKYLIATILCLLLMVVWIFVTVSLTGGKEIKDFNSQDQMVMVIFIIVEVITCVLTFIFADRAGKENRKARPQMSPKSQTKSEKTLRARGVTLMVAALVLAFGFDILGILAGKGGLWNGFEWGLWASIGTAVVLLVLNLLLQKRYINKLENQQVAQLHQFILSHREEAEKTAREKLAFVKKWKHVTDGYAVVLFALGAAGAFCLGTAYNGNTNTMGVLLSALLILCAFSRIRFQTPQSIFEENKTYISQQEYPLLYQLAYQAADIVGCSGKIRICLLPDSGAGIAKIADNYSLQLGVVLLKTLSQEEVYQILLHEFSHVIQEKTIGQTEWEYNNWMRFGRTPHFYAGITNLFFAYFDTVYAFQFGLYQYAASIQIESEADQAMARWGDREVAASALVKIKYYDLFNWERSATGEVCIYENEQPDQLLLTSEIQRFHREMETRAQQWNRLIGREILSRSASHPTMKMRLEALGVSAPQLLPLPEASDYTAECDRALEYAEALIYENRMKTYEEDRKAYYLEPKEQVESWEAAGKPVNAEQYADMVWNLRQLGRTEEAMALCDTVIDTLPNEANHQAYFIRGCYRLHRYEEAGLEDIYFAIENNQNYIEEGLGEIGQFCCLTGNQQELDIYREKAMALAQKEKDEYSQLSTLKKGDRLSSEQLPEGMLEGILDYVRSIDREGSIENIYLVRKTITDTFFCSPVVVRFCADTPEEVCNEILHKIFRYLDTCSDWQFALFRYEEVAKAKVEAVENSCIYSKESEK